MDESFRFQQISGKGPYIHDKLSCNYPYFRDKQLAMWYRVVTLNWPLKCGSINLYITSYQFQIKLT